MKAEINQEFFLPKAPPIMYSFKILRKNKKKASAGAPTTTCWVKNPKYQKNSFFGL